MGMHAVRLATVVAGVGMLATSAIVPANAAVSIGSHAGQVGQVASVERQSFERDMGGWQPDTDGRARDWRIYRTTDQAVDGTFGLGMFLNGLNDEGIIWIERKFAARPNATVSVSVSFWLYSNAGGDVNTWGVVGFARNYDPESTADMRSLVGLVNKRGWSQYTFARKVVTDGTGSVWVAVGLWATYETVRTNHLDLVETSII